VPIAVYLDTRMIDDVVKNALPRVKWRYNAEQDGDWRFEPGRVELRTVEGQVYRALCKTALGHPDNPMSEGQRHEKFVRCVAIAARPMSEAHAGRIIELVSKLERCDQICQLTELIG
jgi:2-methylcitrate dehydratase PrpD